VIPSIALGSAEQKFHEFLTTHGQPLEGPLNHDPSMFHYLRCPQGSKTDARYKFFSDGIPAGYFECWHCGIKDNFCSKQKQDVLPDEWKRHTERLAAERQKNEAETQKVYEKIALLAQDVFATAFEDNADEHSYLKKKQVKNYGLRTVVAEDGCTKQAECYRGTLLVPCSNAKNELVSLERVYFDKKEGKHQKRPLTKGQRIGVFYFIGKVVDPNGVILIAEGYSSAATGHEATGFPAVVAFGASNLINVAKILREEYPQARLILTADDDRWEDNPKLKDTGLKAAKAVCTAVSNTSYVLPDFSILGLSDEALQQEKPTDINDLFVLLLNHNHERSAALELISQQLTPKQVTHSEVLNQLLEQVGVIDFRKLAKLGENDTLKNRHFLISSIEEILRLTESNNWGLCQHNECIYVYNREYWELLDADDLKVFLGAAAEKMGVDAFSAKYFNFRDQLYKQFMALATLPKPEQPKDTVFINLKNGTFEITPHGVKLRDFAPADFLTYQLPFKYIPKTEAPIFLNYLNTVLPEEELQHILAEYLGYVFVQPTTLKLEKALLLYGSGANGKSVFYEVVRSLLGKQNTSEYSLQSLTDNTGYYRAMIANKLVNYASEINGKLEASKFKQLVSGEPVEARLPYGNPFTLDVYAKFIFNCNELPRDVEQTNAYFRRFLIIPFKVTIPEAEQDKELAQKIILTELSGVFNWVLMGLKRLLMQKKFTTSEVVENARKTYELESDSVKLYLAENGYNPHPSEWVAIKNLYFKYHTFCQESGYRPVNQMNFCKRLEATKIMLKKQNVGKVAYLSKSKEGEDTK